MKEIILFASGAIFTLLVPAQVSDDLRSAALGLLNRVGHARQAEPAAPPAVSAETELPAGEAAAAETAAPAPSAAATGSRTASTAAPKSEAAKSPDYISAEEAAEILRAFNGESAANE